MAKLTPQEIAILLAAHPGWRMEGDALVRDFTFANFAHAMLFVNRVADLAEREQHHPNIAIRYNGVRLELVTHDEGGITRRDAEMVGLLGDASKSSLRFLVSFPKRISIDASQQTCHPERSRSQPHRD